ncbi:MULTISPECIES: MFS transporter [unclassified Clostridium]|uniref:MFS transporter n=1 Tax=unclassified Clostridium TaxID=2614128 RepID=UPI001486A9EB|nr:MULTISPECIES: MFS transporter [unclassified Clostridium]
MGNEKKKVHYAWYILGVCILINVIVQALVMQISSLYIVPMYNDLQVPRSLLSLQSVCITVGAVLTAPYWGKLYKKHGARKLLPGCVAVTALCTIGRSLMPNIWGILVLAFIKGVFFTGSTLLPISILLTIWFKEKRGFAISVAAIGTSIGGVIFSPVVERLISTYGWRFSDRAMGLIMLVIVVPVTYQVVRSTPKDVGLRPYGAENVAANGANTSNRTQGAQKEEAQVTGMTAAEARRSPILYVFLLAIFCMTFATGAALQLPVYLTDIGYGSAVAAKVVSGYMAVGIFGKLILGHVTDRFGEKAATVYVCGVGILAFVGFIFAKNQVAFYMMIVAYGLASGITSIMPTLLTSKIFGNRDYGPIYGMVVSVNRFGGVVGTLLVSLLYDITKNYSIIWPACVISMAFTLVATLGCMKLSRKKLAQEQQGKEQPA